MTTLHIEHPITDYDTWHVAFDRLADARRGAGVIAVGSPVPLTSRSTSSLPSTSTPPSPTAFLHFLKTQVWASAAAAPALDGRPRTAILEPGPAAVVWPAAGSSPLERGSGATFTAPAGGWRWCS